MCIIRSYQLTSSLLGSSVDDDNIKRTMFWSTRALEQHEHLLVNPSLAVPCLLGRFLVTVVRLGTVELLDCVV